MGVSIMLRCALAWVSLFCLLLAAIPAIAQNDLYDNGPSDGQDYAWTINFGYVVSNSFTLSSNSQVNGLTFTAWLLPGDLLEAGEVSITSSEFGGTTYFDQVVNFTQGGCVGNWLGFNACTETGSFGPINLNAGTYWLDLANFTALEFDDPVYWDENSGPSTASENMVGTIPSESFTLMGTAAGTGTVPETGSILLFGSGIFGLAAMLRRLS